MSKREKHRDEERRERNTEMKNRDEERRERDFLYIILFCNIYYFNILQVKIKVRMLGVL